MRATLDPLLVVEIASPLVATPSPMVRGSIPTIVCEDDDDEEEDEEEDASDKEDDEDDLDDFVTTGVEQLETIDDFDEDDFDDDFDDDFEEEFEDDLDSDAVESEVEDDDAEIGGFDD